jgi:MFS family permease
MSYRDARMTAPDRTEELDYRTGRLIDVLANRAFLRLWLVQGLSQTGQNMVNFALLILVRGVVDQHGIAQANTAVGLAILSFSIPALFFSPIAGVIVERSSKRKVLVITNVLRGLAVVGFIVIQPDWRPLLALTALYGLAFGSGAAGQFFGPALGSTLPHLVSRRDFVNANALFNLTLTGSQLLGFALIGPTLIRALGVDTVFAIIIGVFIVCAALSLSTSVPTVRPETGGGADRSPARRFWDELSEGVRVIVDRPILMKAIAYLSLATATYLMIAALGPEFVSGVLRLPVEDIAFIVAPAGFGVLVGVLTVGRITSRIGSEQTTDWAVAGAGGVLILLGSIGPISAFIWDNPLDERRGAVYIAGLLAVLLGYMNALILSPSQGLLQSRAPANARARVWSAFFTVSNGVAFIPIVFAGALADLFGVVKVLIAIGVILATVGLYQVSRRHLPPD